jgi:integrase/recombinase XerD
MAMRIPEVLTESEQAALLKVPNKRYPSGERNYLLMRLMLDAGLRLAEVIDLKWQHIDLNTGKLMVREGKGMKDRTLWLNDDALELLKSWRERQAAIAEGADLVFTGITKGKTGNKICRRYLQNMIKRYAERAGIEKNISIHTLRHTFATDIYRQTKNIRLVQKALGHNSIQTTQIYTHILDDELEDALKTFRNPREAI